MVKAARVDEREYQWRGRDPVFHVGLFEPAGESWSEDSWELFECGVLDAIRWAQEHVTADGAWAVALVQHDEDRPGSGGRKGIVYLEGSDPNDHADSLTPWQTNQIGAMIRRGASAVIAGPRSS